MDITEVLRTVYLKEMPKVRSKIKRTKDGYIIQVYIEERQ